MIFFGSFLRHDFNWVLKMISSSFTGFIPLHLAAISGHVKVVLTLLDANTDIDVFSFPTNDTPLSLACSHERLVCCLLFVYFVSFT